MMLGLSDKALGMMTAVIFGLLIVVAVLAASSKAGGFQPMTLDFFGILGKLFGLVEEKVGLQAEGVKNFLCGGDIKRLEERCNIPRDKVAEVCKDKEQIVFYCQSPPDDMQLFCDLSSEDKKTLCDSQKQFYDGCNSAQTKLAEAGANAGIGAIPFCGGG